MNLIQHFYICALCEGLVALIFMLLFSIFIFYTMSTFTHYLLQLYSFILVLPCTKADIGFFKAETRTADRVLLDGKKILDHIFSAKLNT
jgi:hypothetical protein